MAKKQRLPRGKPPSQRWDRHRTDDYDPDDIRYIAMHEAGHAVATVVFGGLLKGVDLKHRRHPDGNISVGFTDSRKVTDKDVAGRGEAAAMPYLVMIFAGPQSEAILRGNAGLYDNSVTQDKLDARLIAMAAVCNADFTGGQMIISPEEQERHRDRFDQLIIDACEATCKFVDGHREAIVNVANALIEKRELTGDEVAAIVNANQISPA